MAAVQRNVLHILIVDDLAHAIRGCIEDHSIGRDLNRYRGLANLELNILCDGCGYRKIEVGDHSFLEARSGDFNTIDANRQRGKKICSGAICLRSRRNTGSLVGYHNLCTWHRCAGSVCDNAVQASCGLRHCRDN